MRFRLLVVLCDLHVYSTSNTFESVWTTKVKSYWNLQLQHFINGIPILLAAVEHISSQIYFN